MPPRLTIKFEGLICHVGPNENTKHHALLINDPTDHKPKIRLSGGAALHLQPRDTVTFEGVSGQHAETGTGFDIVPKLKGLVKAGDIKPNAASGTHPVPHKTKPDGAVAAFVKYPKGTLTVPKRYEPMVTFTDTDGNPSPPQCAPMQVHFTSEDDRNEEFELVVTHHDDRGKPLPHPTRLTLPAGSVIEIENISEKGNHFGEYIHITSATGKVSATKTEEKCPGGLPREEALKISRKVQAEERARAEFAATSSASEVPADPPSVGNPECTNSAWP